MHSFVPRIVAVAWACIAVAAVFASASRFHGGNLLVTQAMMGTYIKYRALPRLMSELHQFLSNPNIVQVIACD